MMEELAINEFRRQVGEYVNQTYYAGKSFVLTKGEKKVAALIPIATLTKLAELEKFYEKKKADDLSADSSMTADNQRSGAPLQ